MSVRALGPALAGSGLTLALLAGGTGIAIAGWTGAGSADLPVGSGTVSAVSPTTAQTCPGVGQYGLTLSWSPVAGSVVGTYDILRLQGTTGTPTVVVGTAPAEASSYADTGLLNGTTYRYVVRAKRGAGWTADSAVVQGTTRTITC